MEKPIVYFTGKPIIWDKNSRGNKYASLHALNHPRLGEATVDTSSIVSMNENLTRIETTNTIYVRVVLWQDLESLLEGVK